jgi:hypothetical protein
MDPGQGGGQCRRRLGAAFAAAVTAGGLVAAVVASQPLAAQSLAHAATTPSALFGAFVKLDRKLTRAIDEAKNGASVELLIHKIRDGKLAIVDGAMTAPIDGVKGSEWFRALDCVDLALNDATHEEHGHLFRHALPFLEVAKRCKQALENELHNAAQRRPFPPRKHTARRPRKCGRTVVVHRGGDRAADVVSCTLTASIRIDPAPNAGTGPGGEVFPGQSVQTRQLAVNPQGATSCGYRLVDPQTGARPGAPFPNQQLQIVFEGLLRQGEWVLSYRVLNYAQSGQDLPPKIWRVMISCLVPSPSAASSPCQAHSVLSDLDGSGAHTDAIDFSCRLASTQFKLTVPSGYRIDYAQNPHKLGANGDHYNCAFASTHVAQDTVDCSGGSSPKSTLFLPIDTTPTPTIGLPVQLSITLDNGQTVTVTTRAQ